MTLWSIQRVKKHQHALSTALAMGDALRYVPQAPHRYLLRAPILISDHYFLVAIEDMVLKFHLEAQTCD